MPISEITALRLFIAEHFDLEELRTLCQDLGVDFDSLDGQGKESKVRELLAYMERHTRSDDLFKILERERPKAWQSLELAWSVSLARVTTPVFWEPYLRSISQAYQDWHLPDEIRSLIDWQVNPVPIDDYLTLRPISTLPLLKARAATAGEDTREQCEGEGKHKP